ncbi:MAG: hypothetical protein MUD08_17260 [Cytophagales bacterium]|jgi:YD repeat-containing protein|nr:hypothetical protein [Cytophagales bacterium]
MLRKSVLVPVFLALVCLSACRHHEETITVGCKTSQYNDILFQYDAQGRLRSVRSSERAYTFIYNGSGNLGSIEASGTRYPVQTDAAGNITEAMGHRFGYDDRNRMVLMEPKSGNLETFRRFVYGSDGNLTQMVAKGYSPEPTNGPPPIVEFLSFGNLAYDTQLTPWANDKVLQWTVATSLLVPFETLDRAAAYSEHNPVRFSFFYAEAPAQPRFTSSVSYTYGDNGCPIQGQVSGNAGAFANTYAYDCGNNATAF